MSKPYEEMDHQELCNLIALGDELAIRTRLHAIASRKSVNVLFRGDWNSYAEALRELDQIGDWLVWDEDEFHHHNFRATAKCVGIKIKTRKHNLYSARIIMRTK